MSHFQGVVDCTYNFFGTEMSAILLLNNVVYIFSSLSAVHKGQLRLKRTCKKYKFCVFLV
jgi:hypothetical protein